MSNKRQRSALAGTHGFTLVELLMVISIISLLAALLFPVLETSKKGALRSSCQSNLQQIGLALSLYANDFDDLCPYAIDRYTRDNPDAIPLPHGPVANIPDMVTVLLNYAGKSKEVFRCPVDKLPYNSTSNEVATGSFPSYFAYSRSSYDFWALDYLGKTLVDLSSNPKLRFCHDALTLWHQEYDDETLLTKNMNSLFGDGHVEFTPRVLL